MPQLLSPGSYPDLSPLKDPFRLKFPVMAGYKIDIQFLIPSRGWQCEGQDSSPLPMYTSPSWEVYATHPPGPTCLRFPLRSPEAKCWPSGLTCMTRTPAFMSIGVPFSLPRSGKCDMSCRCWMSFSTYTTFSRVCRKERGGLRSVLWEALKHLCNSASPARQSPILQ